MTVRHSAGSRSMTGTRSSPRAAPALLTTMSTRPSSSTVRRASASTASRSATSDTAVIAVRPERPHLLGHRLDVAPPGRLLVVGVAVGRAAGAGQHDVAAGAGQLHGDRAPDRAHPAGPRHDGHLVGQSCQLVRHGETVATHLCDDRRRDRLEVRRRVRSHRRGGARPPVPDPGRPGRHVGRARRPRQRARRRPRRRRARAPGQGGVLPLQLPGVPRGHRRRVQGPLRAGQHELPLRPRRDPATCSTTPTPRPSSSTPRSPSCSRASATGCPRCGAGTSWPTRPAPARTGPCRTSRSSSSGADARRAAEPQRRRPAVPLHRRHHRHAEGRDVAPGRPVQRPRRRRQRRCSASRRRRASRRSRRGRRPTRTRRGRSSAAR